MACHRCLTNLGLLLWEYSFHQKRGLGLFAAGTVLKGQLEGWARGFGGHWSACMNLVGVQQ